MNRILLALFLALFTTAAFAIDVPGAKNLTGGKTCIYSGTTATGCATSNGFDMSANGYSGNVAARAFGSFAGVSGTAGSLSSLTGSGGPSYITVAISGGGQSSTSGTVTFTINRTGWYMVHAMCQSTASGAPTSVVIRNIWGGTAGLYSGLSTETYGNANGFNDQSFASWRIMQVTSAGQTVSINTYWQETATSPNYYGAYTVIPL